MISELKSSGLLREAAFIGGDWISSEKRFGVTNPATGELLGHVPDLDQTATQRAIAAANQSLSGWSSQTGKERSRILRRWFDLICKNREELALLLTLEQGKPLSEARAEIDYAAAYLEWFGEEAKRIYGETIPPVAPGTRLFVLKQAIGVCAAITPWNFPAAMVTRKLAPALAAGCAIILKPSEFTPFSALALAKLAQDAGVPAGTMSVVTTLDAKAIGAELCSNPDVRKLSFTGSTAVGKRLLAACADTVKKVSLELGGNAPLIVFDDADLDLAVGSALAGKYRNAGQTCISPNRIFVHDAVYKDFSERLTSAVSRLHVAPGTSPESQVGPVINEAAVQKIEHLVADAVGLGGRILCGGSATAPGSLFFQPTVIADVSADMRVAREEVFGPVASLIRFSTDAELIAKANDTSSGLAAYMFSSSHSRIWSVAEALQVGMVGVNTTAISTEVAPFGGIKESGLGREGSHHGLDDYLELKYLCVA